MLQMQTTVRQGFGVVPNKNGDLVTASKIIYRSAAEMAHLKPIPNKVAPKRGLIDMNTLLEKK
jgi:hypothetical protein